MPKIKSIFSLFSVLQMGVYIKWNPHSDNIIFFWKIYFLVITEFLMRDDCCRGCGDKACDGFNNKNNNVGTYRNSCDVGPLFFNKKDLSMRPSGGCIPTLLAYLISLCFFQSLLKTCATFLLLYDGRNKTIIKKFHCIRVECFSRTLAWMKPNTKAIPLLHKTGGYSISQNECFVGEKHIRVGDDGKEYTLTFTCEQGNRSYRCTFLCIYSKCRT